MPCGKPWYISGVGVATRLLQSTRIAVQLTGLKLETPWGKSEHSCMFQPKLPLVPYCVVCPNLDTTTWCFLWDVWSTVKCDRVAHRTEFEDAEQNVLWKSTRCLDLRICQAFGSRALLTPNSAPASWWDFCSFWRYHCTDRSTRATSVPDSISGRDKLMPGPRAVKSCRMPDGRDAQQS